MRGWGIGRLAVVTGLLVLAALGAGARAGAHLPAAGLLGAGAGPEGKAWGLVLVALAGALLAVLAVALARRARRRRDEQEPEPALTGAQRALALLAALTMAGLLAAAIVVTVRGQRAPAGSAPAPAAPVAPRLPALRGPGSAAGAALAGTVAGALVVLAGAAAIMLWARRRKIAAGPEPSGGRAGRQAAVLAAAVEAGGRALDAGSDARSAIIACYAAMEAALARAGSPRRAADTPEELLGRATGTGLVRAPGGRRLTELFREARFSVHPVGEPQRRAAREALGEILADLGRPASGQGGCAGGGPGRGARGEGCGPCGA